MGLGSRSVFPPLLASSDDAPHLITCLISGILKYGTTDLERLKHGLTRLAGRLTYGVPVHDKGPSSELSGIRLLSLLTAVRPPPGLVKLKHGIMPTPPSGETQVWNPSDLVSSSMASPRLSSSSPNLILVTCLFISCSPLNWTN